MADVKPFPVLPGRSLPVSLAHLPQRRNVSQIALGTGWWELDQIYRLYPGQFTICTGLPGHGKSTFVLNMLANLARTHGTKSYLFVPENEAHLLEKMHRIWGNQAGFDRFCAEQCWVQSAVPTSHESPATTINWVLEQAVFAIERHGVDVLVIDPWNELEWAREKNETLTEYIGWCLKFLKYFARAHDVAVIVVAHPTKARVAGSGPVTLADIEGSAHWWNKSDNGLIVVREQGATKVISAKVREQGAGKLGACYFKVDPDTEQFFPMHGAVDVTG